MNATKVSLIGSVFIILAAASGILVNFFSRSENLPEASPSPTVIVTMARSSEPTPTPTITDIKLYAYGSELDESGFTMYVGDRPVELTAKIEPALTRLPVYWSFSDQDSVSLAVDSETKTCKINALKPSGKNELTVSCYGAKLVIPVFLWEK